MIPILLRPVDWEITPISMLQALPSNGLPVISWSNRDEAFHDVARGIRQVIQTLSRSHYQPPAQKVKLVTFSNIQKVSNPPPDPDPPPKPSIEAMWQEEGVQGERIGWYVEDQEWGQAEAAARAVPGIVPRSRIMGKLVTALIQAQQWQRAEAIALAEHKQWQRAEAVAHSIESYSIRANVFRELSLAARSAGERNIALSLMQEAERLATIEEVTGYVHRYTPEQSLLHVEPSSAYYKMNLRPPSRRSSSYWHHILLLLSLACAITAITRLGPAPLTVIAWIVAGELFILWTIIIIARRY